MIDISKIIEALSPYPISLIFGYGSSYGFNTSFVSLHFKDNNDNRLNNLIKLFSNSLNFSKFNICFISNNMLGYNNEDIIKYMDDFITERKIGTNKVIIINSIEELNEIINIISLILTGISYKKIKRDLIINEIC